MKTTVFQKLQKNKQITVLGILCVISSFAIGINSVGEVQPFALIEAGSTQLKGDMNGDGILTSEDVTIMLEIAEGYRDPTGRQLEADPTQNGHITADDAMIILSKL